MKKATEVKGICVNVSAALFSLINNGSVHILSGPRTTKKKKKRTFLPLRNSSKETIELNTDTMYKRL